MEDAVLAVGILILIGLVGGKIAHRFALPSVTGYIIFGLLIGPTTAGLLSQETIDYLTPLNDLALGLIAFTIGTELSWDNLRKLGKGIVNITLAQSLTAFILVTGAMLLLRQSVSVALLLGAVCTATAPAATVAVIREYNAKGPLTKTLLAVVALDDALCVLVFGIVLTMVKGLSSTDGFSLGLLGLSLLEIAGSVFIGMGFAIVLAQVLKRLRLGGSEILALLLGMTMLGSGLALQFGLSPILTNMVLGGTIINVLPRRKLYRRIEGIEDPVYIAFFTLAGASLDLGTLTQIGVIGVVYVLSRSLGKYLGAYLGGVMSNTPAAVNKYLGLALLPQAGVAIGLSILVTRELPELGGIITSVVLGAVVVYELLGPVFAKIALVKAGEINESCHS
ncbi:MAG: cation:proton antiporter [bacterium]|jgi:Kef-type K+ transport system membrane component KefB